MGYGTAGERMERGRGPFLVLNDRIFFYLSIRKKSLPELYMVFRPRNTTDGQTRRQFAFKKKIIVVAWL
jgi:hypothetical protein